MMGCLMNWKDLEGSGCGLTEILFQNLPEGIKEDDEIEPSTSSIYA
jgi:hypothetical protein